MDVIGHHHKIQNFNTSMMGTQFINLFHSNLPYLGKNDLISVLIIENFTEEILIFLAINGHKVDPGRRVIKVRQSWGLSIKHEQILLHKTDNLVGLTPASTIVTLEGILKEKAGLFPTR